MSEKTNTYPPIGSILYHKILGVGRPFIVKKYAGRIFSLQNLDDNGILHIHEDDIHEFVDYTKLKEGG